ncbi:MAG: hypothetical protein CM1200mP30_05920 [Pseudomonadota bacterium]|nr:MAG: hypothetical protein CM1200mP30_05920 [Pseudomonadota bacterium]
MEFQLPKCKYKITLESSDKQLLGQVSAEIQKNLGLLSHTKEKEFYLRGKS